MNASSDSRLDMTADNAEDSYSDTSSDDISDHYQPISSVDGNEYDDANNPNINGYHHQSSSLSNGHDYTATAAENGVRSLNLSEDEEESDSDEERRGVEMDREMRRAFEEDESRRNTPLSSENAVRVIEAMRGISFSGMPPDWVREVPEDRWLHQLQRLRQPPHSTA